MMKKTVSENILSVWYGETSTGAWHWLWLLTLPFTWPLSILFRFCSAFRRVYFSLKIGRQKHLHETDIPIVVVGNITLGGTGKTPLLCTLADELKAHGLRVGIISRGYGGSWSGNNNEPYFVSVQDNASVVGDEPLLLAQRTGCPVVIARHRASAVLALKERNNLDLILSDDGMQHYAMARSVEIAVLDATRGLGNGLCLPAGPLREAPSRLKSVDFVVVNEGAFDGNCSLFRTDQIAVSVEPSYWRYVTGGQDRLPLDFFKAGAQVHAVAGIGNPQRFFATLRAMGLNVIEHPLPDHHIFSASDLLFADSLPVVITEKDAVKCESIAHDGVYSLVVSTQVPKNFIAKLISAIRHRKNK